MDYIIDGIKKAILLIFTADREVFSIVLVSLRVSCIAIIFAIIIGVLLGFMVATKNFPGRRIIATILNTLMALPAVVVGLTVYTFLSRRGPLGMLGLLFTQTAMVIGQIVLATPIIAALTMSAIQGVDIKVRKTALTLGATGTQAAWAVLSEAKFGLVAAIIAGFGRIIAEVGSAIMLGGNIKGSTRTITTAIALETSKGEFGLGIALGIILLIIAFGINILLHRLQKM
ncbi:ABC transporter permease subunit [Candidatus Poribacteria bacterium]|nr:ABC transporter permease subunit [Candidatus Poribacteria bacterium]